MDEANYFVMLDNQGKKIQQVIDVNNRVDVNVIGNLLNYTFFELLNKEKIVTITRWYGSVRSRLQALRALVKLYLANNTVNIKPIISFTISLFSIGNELKYKPTTKLFFFISIN